MQLRIYNEIVEIIQSFGSRSSVKHIAKLYPEYNEKTIGSIYSQLYQRKMKKNHHKHYATEKQDEYYLRFCEETSKGGKQVLLKLAEGIDLAPSLLARIVLERHLLHTQYKGEPAPRPVVTAMLKDTCLIEHPILALEIQQCVLADENYGPHVDNIKRAIGHEYEFLLKRLIEKNGLAYLDEDQLRGKGYDKTPDFKLEVPIAVDGHVVNWIESKASFGDESSQEGYLKDQFWSYWNRFGPGLVIYWFGFIDELDVNREKGILLMDHFPENIVKMSPAVVHPIGS